MTKSENYFFIFLSLVFLATYSFLLSHIIRNYTAYNYTYDDVTYEQLTFMSYEERHNSKSGTSYKFYFEESDEPLVINNITSQKLDKKALAYLEKGQTLKVCIPQDDPNEICELSTYDHTLLSLSDYNKVNQDNQTLGFIVLPIMLLASLGLLIYFVGKLKSDKQPKEYYRIKLSLSVDGNEIQVCESLRLCTLTVNGKALDQCPRPVGRTPKQTAYRLKGTFKSEGKRITVEAKNNGSFLLLYYDGRLIKRRYTDFDL